MDEYLSYRLVNSFTMQGAIATAVSTNVVIGLILGRTMCSYSCTNPPVFDECVTFVDTFNTIDINLSAALYNAQKLGAQYAWHKPRLNGNKREMT